MGFNSAFKGLKRVLDWTGMGHAARISEIIIIIIIVYMNTAYEKKNLH